MENVLLGVLKRATIAERPLSLRMFPHIRLSIQTFPFSLEHQRKGNSCHMHKKENEIGQLSVLLVAKPL